MKQHHQFSSPESFSKARFSIPETKDHGCDSLHPVFSFEYLTDKQWKSMQKDEKSSLSDKLFRVCKYSCMDLRKMGRDSGSEYIKIEEIHCPLPNRFITETGAVVFHMSGNIAVICFKENHIHYIVEIDRNFKAYDHGS